MARQRGARFGRERWEAAAQRRCRSEVETHSQDSCVPTHPGGSRGKPVPTSGSSSGPTMVSNSSASSSSIAAPPTRPAGSSHPTAAATPSAHGMVEKGSRKPEKYRRLVVYAAAGGQGGRCWIQPVTHHLSTWLEPAQRWRKRHTAAGAHRGGRRAPLHTWQGGAGDVDGG